LSTALASAATGKKRVVLIEDDADIALSLKYNLEKAGDFEVIACRTGEEGLRELGADRTHLVLLDLMLPDMDGLAVCREIRGQPSTKHLPIIMVTARVEERDKLLGFELGADDYVTKPFSVREVLARTRALLRRVEPHETESLQYDDGNLRVDESARTVNLRGATVKLTRREFELLTALIRSGDRILSRETLLDRIWGYRIAGATRTVDVHVRRLRRKLGASYVETVIGVGYRFKRRNPLKLRAPARPANPTCVMERSSP
jgi:two-component system alkaline phosphatase synthesis response regulator PhoP